MRQKGSRVVKQVGDCHAEGREVGEEWHFASFVGGSVIETDRLGTFIYVENMHKMKKSVAMYGRVGRFNRGLKPVDLELGETWESLASN
jgi:hypothetical protein